MKNILTCCLIIAFAPAIFAQEGGSPAKPTEPGWTQQDRKDFIGECIKAAGKGMSTDSAKYYCYCMQEKMEVLYPKIEDAGKVTAEDLNQPEWVARVKSCLTNFWTTQQRADFVSECVTAAKANLSEEKAISYCECMLFKVQARFPDFKTTSELTTEKLNTPEWKKIIQACLAF